MNIDVAFDPRSEAGTRDPDRFSPTLRRYHQALWAKRLPNGALFDLSIDEPGEYLHHRSHLGEYWLSSDNIVATYSYWERAADLLQQIPSADVEEFDNLGSTVGGTIIFPSNRIEGAQTLNARRGSSAAIGDRFDLTLECIRRHYEDDEDNPLGQTLRRYSDFFGLFASFTGYVDFFLLQDLVMPDGSIHFFLPHEGFDRPPIPQDVAEYQQFREASMAFVRARNERITRWAAARTP